MVIYYNLVEKACSDSDNLIEILSTICTSIFVVYHVLILIIWLLVIDSLAEVFVAQANALDIFTDTSKFAHG